MYLEFFKLKEMPFRLAPDARFIHWSTGHTGALARMKSARARPRGRVVITGDKGAGKTTLLEYLVMEEPRIAAARIDFPPRSLDELTEMILKQADLAAGESPVVLVVDNAHLFSGQMLSAILRRSGLPPVCGAAMRVFLMGEPALAQTLHAPALADLWEPGDEHFHLPPLASWEIEPYMEHRLALAGAAERHLFHEDAGAEIRRHTGGNPRMVNALCDAALFVAWERELPQVGLAEIRRGLEDIGRLASAQQPRVPEADATPEYVSASPAVLARIRLMHEGVLLLERALTAGRLRIGRGYDNDVQINSSFISRHHCQILTNDRMCILEDVHSTNGLYVNERRVRNHRLCDGDVIMVGKHQLHYSDLRDRAPAEVRAGVNSNLQSQ